MPFTKCTSLQTNHSISVSASYECPQDVNDANKMKLVGGKSPNEGLLMVRLKGQCGLVCETGGFYDNPQLLARMVCVELGFAQLEYTTDCTLKNEK